MKTQRERDAEKREQKLRDIDEAVESGGLVIRPMTAKERTQFPAREPQPARPARRR